MSIITWVCPLGLAHVQHARTWTSLQGRIQEIEVGCQINQSIKVLMSALRDTCVQVKVNAH